MARVAVLTVAAVCLLLEDLAFLAARQSKAQVGFRLVSAPKPFAGTRRAAANPLEVTEKTREDVWAEWDACLPDAETLEILRALQLSEEWKGALLMEAVRWASRGDATWLRRWASAALQQPSALSGEEPSPLGASDITRLALHCLAELMARSREGLLRNELRALAWFFEFMLSSEGRDERQIAALRSSVHEELEAQGLPTFTAVTEGVLGGDLPICVGDVLTLISDFCDALELKCPYPRDLDNHLDVLLFVNLVQAFSGGRQWKPTLPPSLTATRAQRNARQLLPQLPLAQDTVRQRERKMTRAEREDRERVEGTALSLAWAALDEELTEGDSEVMKEPSPEAAPEPPVAAQPPLPPSTAAGQTQASGSRKLSDVRQRRDARVRWAVEEEEDEAVPTRNGGLSAGDWRSFRGAPTVGPLGRASMYMHHITAPWKQRFILQAASSAGLSGRCLFGKPGRILVEGPIEIVEKYTSQIRSWPWKTCDLQGPWQVEQRAFDAFGELNSNSEFKKAVARAGLREELSGFRSGT